jgi:hypothetical protein
MERDTMKDDEQEQGTATTGTPPTGTTSETPANPQPGKRRRVTVDTSAVAASPPKVIPGQLAVPTTGVTDVPQTAPYKRGPGRPRGSFGGKPSSGFPPVTSRQIREDERRTAEERETVAACELSPIDWINLRYIAENLLGACQKKDAFETCRILGILGGVTRHMGLTRA